MLTSHCCTLIIAGSRGVAAAWCSYVHSSRQNGHRSSAYRSRRFNQAHLLVVGLGSCKISRITLVGELRHTSWPHYSTQAGWLAIATLCLVQAPQVRPHANCSHLCELARIDQQPDSIVTVVGRNNGCTTASKSDDACWKQLKVCQF